ncbi:MAG: spore cortex biosynthesis protein YabQ [Oscillospiraceae bacterium]|nr:spore cortex biosynthesis protein YabQ [Oscillospiraceae bacterium]
MGLETFFTVPQQLLLFLLSVITGIGLGIVYDIFRAFRVLIPLFRKKAATAAADVLYMLIFGITVFLFSAVFGRGQVRFFYAAGAGIGALLYILTAGNVVIGILRCCCGRIHNTAKAVSERITDVYIHRIRKKRSDKIVKCHKKHKNT